MFSGQRLKEIREAQGMSQASVAKHLGISRSSYFNWENGKTKPNQKNLSVLAELFGVAETYFLSEHEIVEVYLELNEENRQEALRLTKALLEEQEAEKQKAPVIPLYFLTLSALLSIFLYDLNVYTSTSILILSFLSKILLKASSLPFPSKAIYVSFFLFIAFIHESYIKSLGEILTQKVRSSGL